MAFLIAIVAALGIGVLIAAQLGPAMLDPAFFIPFACLSAFFSGHTSGTPLWKAMARPLCLMAVIFGIALLLINLDPPRNRWPDLQTAISALVLAVSCSFFAASSFRFLHRRSGVNVARWVLRATMLALYCLYRWMPGEWFVWLSEQGSHWVLLAICLAFTATGLLFLKRAQREPGN